MEGVDLEQSRLGLGHTFSRNKIALDVNRQDKPIIQSINLLELLDKDVNTFAMRIKEWYSWHYPELARIITDNVIYVRLVRSIGVLVVLFRTVKLLKLLQKKWNKFVKTEKSLRKSSTVAVTPWDKKSVSLISRLFWSFVIKP